MRFVVYDNDRLGIIDGDAVVDVTDLVYVSRPGPRGYRTDR